jgi:hypothetical protein
VGLEGVVVGADAPRVVHVGLTAGLQRHYVIDLQELVSRIVASRPGLDTRTRRRPEPVPRPDHALRTTGNAAAVR